ncbi:hypothetical protein [Rhodopseudomonas palustris]|uniref:hypothetical protein n=1 Tax=Rhodopseudomonas palustris TaxID=1076 RepID=UPI000E5BACCA|nr:hypothetical protein [Rhodopseudomonas palustris]QLH72314.1 hypothetical protein HZF03_16550 [Rhodopseudomonas palustris]RHZ93392.1 hypothetical protein D1920_21000 [Rhodopseudomonas palustris]
MSINFKTAWWPAWTGRAARSAESRRVHANDNVRSTSHRTQRPALALRWHISSAGTLMAGWTVVPSDDAAGAEGGDTGDRVYQPPSRAA